MSISDDEVEAAYDEFVATCEWQDWDEPELRRYLTAALRAAAKVRAIRGEGEVHAQRLRKVAAQLAAERIQGWANPLVSVLTDAADYLDRPGMVPPEVVLSPAATGGETV